MTNVLPKDLESIRNELNELQKKLSSTIAESEPEEVKGLRYVIVRGNRSGVFIGYLKQRTGTEVTLLQCRHIYYWEGAVTIVSMGNFGVTKPEECNFSKVADEVLILDAIEIVETTENAKQILQSVGVRNV